MACRICLEDTGELISPCACKGSAGYVHSECLDKWVHMDGAVRKECEICQQEFASKDECSYQPLKYCQHCWSFKITGVEHLKMLSKIFGLSVIGIAWTPIDYYIIISSITTLSAFVAYLLSISDTFASHKALNCMVIYKCTFSLAYFLGLLVTSMTNEEMCDTGCVAMGLTCDAECPLYDRLLANNAVIEYTFILDIGNILLLVLFRAIVLCFIYMRKKSYQNLMEDQVRLLSNCNSSPSSPSSASGAV